mmetsp:Transcript_30081/g.63791  ORF Transcript_30081/g.63791 Transcript_30081/m.63791 type:complete len:616 (+) Transcript_30081:145-1992(+)
MAWDECYIACHVQLESDILNMSSRKASVREAMERRIEQTDGFSGEAAASKMERLTSGGDDVGTMNDDDRKMSKSALARTTKKPPMRTDSSAQQTRRIPASRSTGRPASDAQTRTNRSFGNNRASSGQELPERHLVPHFSGFTFKHESDRDWLGLSGNNGKMKPQDYLGETPTPVQEKDRLRAETPIFEEDYSPTRKKEDVVYFNSNNYLGQQYLSPDAMRAGYELGDDRPSPDESIVEFMENRSFESDPDQLIVQAEARLLHALAKFPQARAAMRTVYSTSTFGPSNMHWTSEEREWLFLSLTGSPEIDPPLPVELLDGGTPSQLHLYLANRQDCPEHAFNKDALLDSESDHDASPDNDVIETAVESSSDQHEHNINDTPMEEIISSEEEELDSFLELSSQVQTESDTETVAEDDQINYGLLDEYFLETDMFPSFSKNSIAKETRAELTVQETVATLLRATAMKRFSTAKSKLTQIVSEMDRQDGDEDGDDQLAEDNDSVDISSDELQELFLKVGNEVVDAQKSLYDTERSSDRVNSHLLDYSVTNGVQSKQSQAQLDRLDRMMDEHIANLPEDGQRPHDAFGSDDELDGEIDPMFERRNPDEHDVVRGLSTISQ